MKYGIAGNKNSLLPSVLKARRQRKRGTERNYSFYIVACFALHRHNAFMFRKSEETIKME